jgi:CO dehydrogenase nickel-insertion accessory protein CooC1
MRHVDTLVIVSDGASRGIQTAELIKKMVQNDKVIQSEKVCLVFNRVRNNEKLLQQAANEMGLQVFGYIPHDENIAYHDIVGKSILGISATSPGLAAVRNIAANHILG